MWCVIQVLAGREKRTLAKIERLADAATYERCMIPTREQAYRRNGEWKIREEILFPGYIIASTKTPDLFRSELMKVIDTTKLLSGQRDGEKRRFMSLTDVEAKFMTSLVGDCGSTVGVSIGVMEGDAVIVMSGPLRGHEALINRVDRHKRTAWLEVQMFGRTNNVKVGLEIVERR